MTMVLSMSTFYNTDYRPRATCEDDPSDTVRAERLDNAFTSYPTHSASGPGVHRSMSPYPTTPASCLSTGATGAVAMVIDNHSSEEDCVVPSVTSQLGKENEESLMDRDDSPERRGLKRKSEVTEDSRDETDTQSREKVSCRRISPYLNTPKQKKDERRKVLKMSFQKIRELDDPERFLRRSVLIHNIVTRLQQEMREERRKTWGQKGTSGSRSDSLYRRRGVTYSAPPLLYDEPYLQCETEKITDDNTDALVSSLEKSLSCEPLTPAPSSPAFPFLPSSSTSSMPMTSSSSSSSTDTMTVTSTTVSVHCNTTPSLTSQEKHVSGAASALASPLEAGAASPKCTLSLSASSSPTPMEPTEACDLEDNAVLPDECPANDISESEQERQIFSDLDAVFNNLIRAFGDP